MRSTLVCLALCVCLAGAAGLSAASVPVLGGRSFGVSEATQATPPRFVKPAVSPGESQPEFVPAPGQAPDASASAPVSGDSRHPCADNMRAGIDQTFEQARQGDTQAQYWLGVHYEAGLCGLCKDDPLAVVWFKKAAEAGMAEARFALGRRCFFGVGVPQDLTQGAYWMHLAAQQGHAEAQYRFAGCLEDGLGVTEDKAAAVYWYRKSAELGYPQAQNMLGIFYINGTGVPRDAHTASIWFQRAAAQGYATAQFNLARNYEMGEGVDRNREKALYWYQKAARQGDADAQSRLEAF